MKAGLVSAALLGLVATGPAFPAGEGGYRFLAGRDCGGFPRVAADTGKGLCLGLVWQDADHSGTLRLPRDLAPLGGGAWLVTDLGAWDRARGAVWRLTATPGEAPRLERVLGDLETPHTVLLGPGDAYVGEMGRIVVFDPNAADPAASLKVVVGDLPANRLHDNRHPLSAFVFGADGSLLVNVGAPSDQCLGSDGAPAGARCEEGEGPQAQAVVRRYPLASPGRVGPALQRLRLGPAQFGGHDDRAVGRPPPGREQHRPRRGRRALRRNQCAETGPPLWLALLPEPAHARAGLGQGGGHGLRLAGPRRSRRPPAAALGAAGDPPL